MITVREFQKILSTYDSTAILQIAMHTNDEVHNYTTISIDDEYSTDDAIVLVVSLDGDIYIVKE